MSDRICNDLRAFGPVLPFRDGTRVSSTLAQPATLG